MVPFIDFYKEALLAQVDCKDAVEDIWRINKDLKGEQRYL
jgi:hypothetical protein